MVTCKECGGVLLPGNIDGRKVLTCMLGHEQQLPPIYQKHAEQVASGKRKNPEADLVHSIVLALELSGYMVLRVGQYRADLAGQTAGTPDLFVADMRTRRRPYWIGMEVKTRKGQLSRAQEDMLLRGLTFVVRSIDDALKIAEHAFRVVTDPETPIG